MKRVLLTLNNQSRNPKPDYLGLIPINYEALVKFACNKTKINKKHLRLFVCKNALASPSGTEITATTDLSRVLCDDVLITVTKNKDYWMNTKEISHSSAGLVKKLAKTPRYPYPVKPSSPVTEFSSENAQNSISSCGSFEFKRQSFPILEGNVLKLIRKHTRGNPDIVEKVDLENGFVAFDYKEGVKYSGTLEQQAIQKECRGLIVSLNTGQILARRFHKFYNLNENEETIEDQINFSGSVAYEKLDGTLAGPVLTDNGDLIWVTRKVRAPEIEEFIREYDTEEKHNFFARKMLEKGLTPIFEYCVETGSPGVLCYQSKKLVLIGIRNNISGEYSPFHQFESEIQKYSINLPQVYSCNSSQLREEVRSWIDCEGVVIVLPNGCLFKLKSFWWLNMAKACKTGGNQHFLSEMVKLNSGTLKTIPSYRVWYTALNSSTCLEEVSLVSSNLSCREEQQEFLSFVGLLDRSVRQLWKDLKSWTSEGLRIGVDVASLISLGVESGWPELVMEKLLAPEPDKEVDGSTLVNFLKSLAKKRELEVLVNLLDVSWDDQLSKTVISDHLLPEYQFDICNKNIRNHVLETYLPKKISVFLGIKEPNSNTVIEIPRNYQSNEGKIKGYWEMFTRSDIYDLRIDLQPNNRVVTDHFGSDEYALFLVQYGLQNKSTYPYGTFAGVLVPTDFEVRYSDLQEAFEKSFANRCMVRMSRRFEPQPQGAAQLSYDRRSGNKIQQTHMQTKSQIFCDLDGVLCDFEGGVQEVTGRATNQQSVSKMWSRILASSGFFRNLKWTQDGHELWDRIKDQNPTILTGLPVSCKKQVIADKVEWCRQELGAEVKVITCASSEKCKHSNYGSVLIDDRIENCRAWENYGGKAILHSNAARSCYELDRYQGVLKKMEIKNIDPGTLEYHLGDPRIELVTMALPEITDDIVGVDLEWDWTQTEPVSLVQIATSKVVYLVDMLKGSELIKSQVCELMENEGITKLFFDPYEDLVRLQTNLKSVIDLKEFAVDCLPDLPANLGLGQLSDLVIHYTLEKEYDLQQGHWNERPLTERQLKYAARDAAVLLEIFRVLEEAFQSTIPRKHLYLDGQNLRKIGQIDYGDYNPSLPSRLIYYGLFLTEESKSELKRSFPPKFSTVYSDHITLLYQPELSQVPSSPAFGSVVAIQVTGYYEDDRVQAVQVKIEDGNSLTASREGMGSDHPYHITLSCRGDPKEASLITNYQEVTSELRLTAKYGIMVRYDDNPLTVLAPKIQEKINRFLKTAQVGETLKFKPDELSSAERSLVHEFAKDHHLKSESSGKEENRRLTLTMLRKKRDDFSDHQIHLSVYEDPNKKHGLHQNKKKRESFKITDQILFSQINFVGTSGQNIETHGKIGLDFVHFSRNPNINSQCLVILRGLPGSGKSKLAQILSEQYGLQICSADDYFLTRAKRGGDLIYRFEKEKLGEAHQSCYDLVAAYLEMGESVVIDNTNSRRQEYQKYVSLAKEYPHYRVIILEILCCNRVQACGFANRSNHGVPSQVVLKMYDRWETEDSAYLLSPFQEQSSIESASLDPIEGWLTKHRLFHNDKRRGGTHYCWAVGNRKDMFIDIPSKLMDEFYQLYYNSGLVDDGTQAYMPKYLHELPQREFRMFFDLDFGNEVMLSLDDIVEIVKLVQSVLGSRIYVLGYLPPGDCSPICQQPNSVGIHLKCPDCHVDHGKALELRMQVIGVLKKSKPLLFTSRVCWDEILDSEVYVNGLRMLGSRKAKKQRDYGRVYQLICLLESDGSINYDPISGLEEKYQIMEEVSIHIPS